MNEQLIKKLITSTLLLSDGPEKKKYFTDKFDIIDKDLDSIIASLNKTFKENDIGFYISETSSALDLKTIPDVEDRLTSLIPETILRGLSAPAMETLAIIAYEQPVTKAKISEIRGVDSDSSIKTLNSRGLIDRSGELEVPGSPVLYVTTELFNEKMNIGSIEELPRIGSLFVNEEE
tara:strand:- start:242 stop:772 length:531 start_codon:yes stop_codon:yes gene_type:complete